MLTAVPRLIILQPTAYCNITCSYCYLGNRNDRRLMAPAVIEAIREKLLRPLPADASPAIVWHAGEPTTAPIGWYEHAYARLAEVCPAGTGFAMQTNGIAIDERWIDLFRRTGTSVSLSIDGPQRFHDERRRTRNGKPTWALALRGLRRLQDSGFQPRVISVLHPRGLDCPDEYYQFYRGNGICQVGFSVDELEGANKTSSFAGRDYKPAITAFLVNLMETAYAEGYPLHVREVERIAGVLAGGLTVENEQVEPWAAIVVAADGKVSTFSPELMEMRHPGYDHFVFGNILDQDFDDFARSAAFARTSREVAAGVAACRASCRYFEVCRGGSPVNKLSERADLGATETECCRLSTQAAADALMRFLARVAAHRQPPVAVAHVGHAGSMVSPAEF